VIPANLIDPAASLFLRKFTPRPNMEEGMMGCGMTMMGAPTVVGAGVDCNNYLSTTRMMWLFLKITASHHDEKR
jgi:hypothetical protein